MKQRAAQRRGVWRRVRRMLRGISGIIAVNIARWCRWRDAYQALAALRLRNGGDGNNLAATA